MDMPKLKDYLCFIGINLIDVSIETSIFKNVEF